MCPWCFWFTFAQGHLSGTTRVGWRTGSLRTVPPRWSKQTNKRARTWKRQMESHRCSGSKQRESDRRSAGRAEWIAPSQTGGVVNSHWGLFGSLAVLLIVSLISCFPQIKGKQAEQAEAIAFPSEDKSGRFATVFSMKTAERNGLKLNCFSVLLVCCSNESFVGLNRNQKQKFISLSSRLSEAAWTCLFYTGCGGAVLRYIRDHPLAVVMTTAVSSSTTGGFGSFTCWDVSHLLLLMEDRAESLARLNMAFKATSVSKNENQKRSLIFLDVLLKNGWVLHPIQHISPNWRNSRSGPVEAI